jgi:putative transposase
MYFNFDIKNEIKNIILKSKLKSAFTTKHPNLKYSLDLIINEILYFFKSGVSWRMLRSEINHKTLYWHYSRFIKNRIFIKLFNKIKNKYLNKFIRDDKTSIQTTYIDSTIIYNKYGVNKIGRNKFYKNKKTTKISLLTDINGFPLSLFFMKGNHHDSRVFNKHIKDAILVMPKKKLKIIADKAYSSKKTYTFLDLNNIKHIIPPRKNMKIKKTYVYDKKEYIKRIKIEHIFGRLKMYKRISCRYDKLLRNYSGFVYLALSIISINIGKSN